jgi:transcriptional regulator with XRE-family HTH domain
VTYQQAHKYESGINRISSGRLLALAQALGVDVGYLLQGLGDGQQQSLRLERRMIQIAADLEKLDEESVARRRRRDRLGGRLRLPVTQAEGDVREQLGRLLGDVEEAR